MTRTYGYQTYITAGRLARRTALACLGTASARLEPNAYRPSTWRHPRCRQSMAQTRPRRWFCRSAPSYRFRFPAPPHTRATRAVARTIGSWARSLRLARPDLDVRPRWPGHQANLWGQLSSGAYLSAAQNHSLQPATPNPARAPAQASRYPSLARHPSPCTQKKPKPSSEPWSL